MSESSPFSKIVMLSFSFDKYVQSLFFAHRYERSWSDDRCFTIPSLRQPIDGGPSFPKRWWRSIKMTMTVTKRRRQKAAESVSQSEFGERGPGRREKRHRAHPSIHRASSSMSPPSSESVELLFCRRVPSQQQFGCSSWNMAWEPSDMDMAHGAQLEC